MLFGYCFGLFNPNPQQMRSWSSVLFLLVFLKLTWEVGKGWLLPDQTPGLPEDAKQLCPRISPCHNPGILGNGLVGVQIRSLGGALWEMNWGHRCLALDSIPII